MNYIIIFLSFIFQLESEPVDTFMLQAVDVVASLKLEDEEKGAYSSTGYGRVALEQRHIYSFKELSSVVPNFYQPDYGSRMTSSMYVRGFGSRIDQPVVGLNVDGVPVMNKNLYDFDLFDVDNLQVIRGAQSTLYGRNTAGGAINVRTLSPLNFQGKRLMLEYGNENNVRVKASHYAAINNKTGWTANVFYNHSDGFFMNKERGENCDAGDSFNARFSIHWQPTNRLGVSNSITAGYVDEGGYAYRFYDKETASLAPVAYNDACTYRRFTVSDGFAFRYRFDDFTLSSITGYSFINDRMRLDNDFLPDDYFTLGQYQKEHSVTQEIVAKSSDEKAVKWLGGLFAFYKHKSLDAPVFFKKDGIEKLILENANAFLEDFPGYLLSFKETAFPIEDEFKIPAYGAALYGRLTYSLGCFDFSAGLRFDYEYSSMDYNSFARLHYKFLKESQEYEYLESVFKGNNSVDSYEFLPCFSVNLHHKWGNTYFSVGKGYKAGGFNTQLFSDILRKKLTEDIISSNSTDGSSEDASSTIYRPETNWTYELGTNLRPFSDASLCISATLFYIDCRNQQLTVHPKGSAGRAMSNAGRSHSYGGEISVNYAIGDIVLDCSYGYAHAEFKEFADGDSDYSGNVLPYAPRETVSANLCYNIPVSRDFANHLRLNVGWSGVGRIYWNESNTLTQAFYGLLSASLSWEKRFIGVSLWGKNILDEEYNAFYFNSIDNDFFAQGKPRQVGVSLYVNL